MARRSDERRGEVARGGEGRMQEGARRAVEARAGQQLGQAEPRSEAVHVVRRHSAHLRTWRGRGAGVSRTCRGAFLTRSRVISGVSHHGRVDPGEESDRREGAEESDCLRHLPGKFRGASGQVPRRFRREDGCSHASAFSASEKPAKPCIVPSEWPMKPIDLAGSRSLVETLPLPPPPPPSPPPPPPSSPPPPLPPPPLPPPPPPPPPPPAAAASAARCSRM